MDNDSTFPDIFVDYRYMPNSSSAISSDEAKKFFGVDEDFLWKRVTDGSIKAYFYVHEKMELRYKGSKLTSNYYEISWPDLYILGTKFYPNIQDTDTICVNSLDGELENPINIVRHAIRFDVEDLAHLLDPSRGTIELDLDNAVQEENIDDSFFSLDYDDAIHKDEKKPNALLQL